jgi:hypothetical protein
MSLPRPNESYLFQANLIWRESPYKDTYAVAVSQFFLPQFVKEDSNCDEVFTGTADFLLWILPKLFQLGNIMVLGNFLNQILAGYSSIFNFILSRRKNINLLWLIFSPDNLINPGSRRFLVCLRGIIPLLGRSLEGDILWSYLGTILKIQSF